MGGGGRARPLPDLAAHTHTRRRRRPYTLPRPANAAGVTPGTLPREWSSGPLAWTPACGWPAHRHRGVWSLSSPKQPPTPPAKAVEGWGQLRPAQAFRAQNRPFGGSRAPGPRRPWAARRPHTEGQVRNSRENLYTTCDFGDYEDNALGSPVAAMTRQL